MNTTTANESIGQAEDMHPERLVVAVVMARVTEFFGFFVYAIASALVFPTFFFPNFDPLTGTLLSFSVFSLAFLARPLGGIVFRGLYEKVGRAAKLTSALFVFGGCTMLIGFLPGYAEIGIVAPILLVVFRIGQGVGLGGAWDGLVSLMVLNAPANKRGWYGMIPQLGAPLGFILAASIYFVLTNYLRPEEFITWGWRFGFFVALALNVVALFARLRLIDTEEFANVMEREELHPTPLFEVIRRQWKQVLLGAYIPLASFALFHLLTVFPLGYTKLFSDQPIPDLLALQLAGGVIALVTVILSGILADRFGRRLLLMITAVAIAVFSIVAVDLLDTGSGPLLIGFALLGLAFGQAGGALPNRFTKKYRYTGTAFSTDLAWIFGAAFAPLVALGLTSQFGLVFAGYYLLSGAVATFIALVIVNKSAH